MDAQSRLWGTYNPRTQSGNVRSEAGALLLTGFRRALQAFERVGKLLAMPVPASAGSAA